MSTPFKLIIGEGRADDAANELSERLMDVIYDFAGRINVATAVGTLELVKAQVISDALDDD